MQVRKINVSVVVLAHDHNPTILHPSFLKSKGIVPEDLELAERPISTPPFSVVKFKNGITFTVESNKFQVLQSPPPPQLQDSIIPKYTTDYILLLPHVRYTAVGINILVGLTGIKPEEYLIGRFVNHDRCSADDLQLRSASLRFVYAVDNSILSVSCEPGMVPNADYNAQEEGIIVSANYHTELIPEDAVKKATEAISEYTNRCEHFIHILLPHLFEIEENLV